MRNRRCWLRRACRASKTGPVSKAKLAWSLKKLVSLFSIASMQSCSSAASQAFWINSDNTEISGIEWRRRTGFSAISTRQWRVGCNTCPVRFSSRSAKCENPFVGRIVTIEQPAVAVRRCRRVTKLHRPSFVVPLHPACPKQPKIFHPERLLRRLVREFSALRRSHHCPFH